MLKWTSHKMPQEIGDGESMTNTKRSAMRILHLFLTVELSSCTIIDTLGRLQMDSDHSEGVGAAVVEEVVSEVHSLPCSKSFQTKRHCQILNQTQSSWF